MLEVKVDPAKILTVSVAAYNAEEYLERALDSCLIGELDKLEIIIVDDGSTDGTLAIARSYENRYPGTFRTIAKKNGGYGSTMNASLPLARGRYFKLLDSDDAFDTEALEEIVKLLADCTCDMVLTPFFEVRDTEETVVDQISRDKSGLVAFRDDIVTRLLSMHSVTYRTELLRTASLRLPEKRLYTDCLFVTLPLASVQDVYISHKPLYRYTLGRVGQSVSFESETRHREDKKALVDDLLALFEATGNDSPARTVIGYWLSANSGFMLRLLYGLDCSGEIWDEIMAFEETLRAHPEAYRICRDQSRWFRLLANRPKIIYSLMHRIAESSKRGQNG